MLVSLEVALTTRAWLRDTVPQHGQEIANVIKDSLCNMAV
jgi:hypothetical protein